jgi:hypothetical protein
VLVAGRPLGCLAIAGPSSRLGGRLEQVAATLQRIAPGLAADL